MSEPTPRITNAVHPDLDSVRSFITEMIGRGAIAMLITAIIGLLTRMRDLNTELVAKLAAASKKRPPREDLRQLQLELPLLFAQPANDGVPPKTPAQKPDRKRRATPHGRPKLPAHLPRIPEIHLVPAAERTCPNCEAQAEPIGFKVTEKLDVDPARFIVRQVKRETIACPCCHGYVCTAPKQDEVLDRGILGNELLGQAMVDHYDDAVPWERMERSARQQGVPLAANTLAASVGRCIDLLDPVIRHIRQACLASTYTALDATRMPVLDSEHPLGIRSGSLWLVEGAHKYACFLYAPSGHACHLERFLAGSALGSVMCDGSATNNCVDRAGANRGGCNAHARRRLVEAVRCGDARAIEGLELFAAIFHVDAESLRARESIDLRFARRQTESAPLVQRLRDWVDIRRAEVEPKCKLGKALGYIDRQWKRLTAFLRDPLIDLTNNEVERDLRRGVLDRKTWMFVGHDQSAQRAADALTIITTCRKHGIDSRRYIRDTLNKILNGEKKMQALLPENFSPTAHATPGIAA